MPLLGLWCYMKVFDVIVHECTYEVYEIEQSSCLFMSVMDILKHFMIFKFCMLYNLSDSFFCYVIS